MLEMNNLRSCGKCGNVFLKQINENEVNRCPACNVWKKESI
ncbi:hypothetical protein [Nitrosopumilus sp.]|nr:hypothetical protein [Nitrosopumilus sp.]